VEENHGEVGVFEKSRRGYDKQPLRSWGASGGGLHPLGHRRNPCRRNGLAVRPVKHRRNPLGWYVARPAATGPGGWRCIASPPLVQCPACGHPRAVLVLVPAVDSSAWWRACKVPRPVLDHGASAGFPDASRRCRVGPGDQSGSLMAGTGHAPVSGRGVYGSPGGRPLDGLCVPVPPGVVRGMIGPPLVPDGSRSGPASRGGSASVALLGIAPVGAVAFIVHGRRAGRRSGARSPAARSAHRPA
jgi:hypothetical protein